MPLPAAVALIFAAVAAADTPPWAQPPFRIQAGGDYLDTARGDTGGHAAPFLADIDGDGVVDLVVGSIDGKFHWYRNTATNSSKTFAAFSGYLPSEDAPAEVPNFCCVASGPQLIDIDKDGVPDLTSGSYAPGALYWFKGRDGGGFGARHMLTDFRGMPVVTHAGSVYDTAGATQSYASNIAWVDWNNDDLKDVLIGDGGGRLFVRLQVSTSADAPVNPPLRGQPMFQTWQQQREIQIDAQSAIPDGHVAPAVADWDGDGRWDILAGSYSGSVYWLRNTGTTGAPEFKSRELLLGAGQAMQRLKPGEIPQRGRRSQIHVADYNLDGKPDLLLGDWFMTMTPRQDLSGQERRALRDLERRLTDLDRKVGYEFSDLRSKSGAYNKNLDAKRKAAELEKSLAPYLETVQEDAYRTSILMHGGVWVFLQKP